MPASPGGLASAPAEQVIGHEPELDGDEEIKRRYLGVGV
jgi:hypothetical protein